MFRKLEPNSEAYRAFLKDAAAKEENTVHREPFKEEPIQAILDAAQGDELMLPLIVTALCTAMRRGDCALLKWSSVDLDAGFIEVRTSKTGETAEIPVLPALREELNRRTKTKSPFVFPEAARLYQEDPHSLDRRLRAILARARFADEKDTSATRKPEPALGIIPQPRVKPPMGHFGADMFGHPARLLQRPFLVAGGAGTSDAAGERHARLLVALGAAMRIRRRRIVGLEATDFDRGLSRPIPGGLPLWLRFYRAATVPAAPARSKEKGGPLRIRPGGG